MSVTKRIWSSLESRKLPRNRVVTVETPGLATPRTDMQVCSASSSTATPRGFKHFVDGDRDLRGQMLLRLQPARIDVDEARQFRQTDDALDRPVGDMRLAVERHHVVLAMRGKTDVADQHEIVVGFGLAERAGERIGGDFAIAAVKLVQGRDDALGRRGEPLARRIVAEIGDQRAHRGLRLLPRRPIFDGRRRGPDMVRMRPREAIS